MTTEKTTALRSKRPGIDKLQMMMWYSQLMQMILTIVNAKNGRGAISTFTSTAVTRNTTRMTDRLPEILNF